MKYILMFEKNELKDIKSENLIEITNSINSKKNLIDLFKKELNFPFSCETNWDAFYDILSDLYWLDINEVVVYHNSLPKLKETDLILYLETIIDLLENSDKTGKVIRFVFHAKDKEKIQSLINMHL